MDKPQNVDLRRAEEAELDTYRAHAAAHIDRMRLSLAQSFHMPAGMARGVQGRKPRQANLPPVGVSGELKKEAGRRFIRIVRLMD
jgi:hypothetical protein